MPMGPNNSPEGENIDPTITTTRGESTTTVVVTGEIDLANAAQLSAAGLDAVAAAPAELVIDLRAVTFMDSSGLGHLTRVLRAAPSTPARILISHPRVAALFRVTGMAKFYTVQQVPWGERGPASSPSSPPTTP